MTELLSKMKKGGKCTGYMNIHENTVEVRRAADADEPTSWHHFYSYDGCRKIDFDSIHPWICKDRNRKDVFEGDMVNMSILGEPQGRAEAQLLPRIVQHLSDGPHYESPSVVDIELIEDQS